MQDRYPTAIQQRTREHRWVHGETIRETKGSWEHLGAQRLTDTGKNIITQVKGIVHYILH